jgi:pilus assembly protein CpaB
MNFRAIGTFGIGIMLAGAAVILVNQRLQSVPPPVQATGGEAIATATVLVAATDVAYAGRLDPAHVRPVRWPADSVPQGTFATADELFGDGSQTRVALRPIAAGEPLLQSRVSGFGGRASMSAVVEEGNRAFTIRVNEVSGVAGFLLPGDRVDILMTRTQDNESSPVTHTILQNIVVRGIDQNTDEGRNQPMVVRAVTVEVTPAEAQKLALAQTVGSLSLSLRNVAASEQTPTRMVSVADLISERREEGVSGPSVRVRNRDAVSTVQVR